MHRRRGRTTYSSLSRLKWGKPVVLTLVSAAIGCSAIPHARPAALLDDGTEALVSAGYGPGWRVPGLALSGSVAGRHAFGAIETAGSVIVEGIPHSALAVTLLEEVRVATVKQPALTPSIGLEETYRDRPAQEYSPTAAVAAGADLVGWQWSVEPRVTWRDLHVHPFDGYLELCATISARRVTPGGLAVWLALAAAYDPASHAYRIWPQVAIGGIAGVARPPPVGTGP